MGTKKRVLLRGPTITSSGYGQHSRQLARYLFSRENELNFETVCQVLPWGTTPWILDENECDGLIGQVMRRTREPGQGKFDLSVQVQLPSEWDPSLAHRNFGVTAGVETDRCSPEWVVACNRMDGIIVPSEHTKRTLESSGKVERPVKVVPEPYSRAFSLPNDELPSLGLPDLPEFCFLIIAQLTGANDPTDRKGTLSAIKWLCEEFSNDPSVGIVVKTNLGRHSIVDRHNTSRLISDVVGSSRRGKMDPKVVLIHGRMTDREMAALYRNPKIKAFVCPTRGEGFGLPILEAAVSGLPVISTAWSAHTETLSAGRTIPVEYQLAEVPPEKIDGRIFVSGARWAQPDERDFKKKARKFRGSPTIPTEWAKSMSEQLKVSHSSLELEKKLDEILLKELAR